jgi:hypothetical protein
MWPCAGRSRSLCRHAPEPAGSGVQRRCLHVYVWDLVVGRRAFETMETLHLNHGNHGTLKPCGCLHERLQSAALDIHAVFVCADTRSGCRGPAASYTQHLTAGRIRAQFAVWYLLLVFSRKGFQGYWSPSLLPHVTDNFWQDLCVGACMVRLGPQPPSLAGEERTR